MGGRTDEFAEFFAARFGSTLRSAYAMCGDWSEAEEICQTAFVKVYAAWHRVRSETADGYLRTVLTRIFLDTRRRGAGLTSPVAEVPDAGVPALVDQVDDRTALVAALRTVPRRQRAALVLRFVQDLSVEQTAAAMGCSVGTVKSQTARGLDALRLAYRAPSPTTMPEHGPAHPPVR
jgi:RNA polymerase sigma-70 factor (sigma-E family)